MMVLEMGDWRKMYLYLFGFLLGFDGVGCFCCRLTLKSGSSGGGVRVMTNTKAHVINDAKVNIFVSL